MTGANGVNGPKSNVAPHFNNLDLRNIGVPLRTPLVSHDTGDNTSCIT